MSTYKNWQYEIDQDHIFWLGFDRANATTNTLNKESLNELTQIIGVINSNSSLKGVVIYSKKENGFIAGADVSQFPQLSSKEEVIPFLRMGQQVFSQLEAVKIPTLALIHGFCLGGGMELALACRYRLALDDKKTKLGLPEINLGFFPGWGGSVRAVRLISPLNALDLILTGRTVSASSAKKMGLIDDAVPHRHFKNAARKFILEQPAAHQQKWFEKLLNTKPMRMIIASFLRKKVAKKAKQQHYPAPYAVISNWERYGGVGEMAFMAEANAIGHIVETSSTPRQLVRVFFLQERMKELGKKSDFTAKHVHVIGAGTMGGDIASWCVLQGLSVTLQDRSPQLIAPAIARAYKLLKKKLKQPRAIQEALDRLQPDSEGHGIRNADVVIEAIIEDEQKKIELFKWVEKNAKPDAILATNTSSIPLEKIAVALQNPERLVGIHFFNPVSKMPLVEIVNGAQTASHVSDSAMAFVKQINRLPLPVKSSPGFLVNRVLMPYLMETMALIEEGVAPEIIDQAAIDFGMPMGPVELADRVGLDVCLSVAKNLTQAFGGVVPDKLYNRVQQGHLGSKSGQGFYTYRNDKVVKTSPASLTTPQKHLIDRLILRMVNEASACLREGVVADADLLDAGMIFGTGFAPFRGGPLEYARSMGKSTLDSLYKQLEQQYGTRFKADDGLHSASSA